jgi:hypothetical protein
MQRKRKKLFMKESKGFVDLYLSQEDVLAALEVLGFTRKLCNSLLNQEGSNLSEDMKNLLQDKMLIASSLEEKIRIDADPGYPDGPIH